MYLKEEAKEISKKRSRSKKMEQNTETKCPLCLEVLEMDDLNFFPCKCEYQVCRFCWHRIRTNENGLCPACRRQYPEDPANFKPLTQEELLKIKNQKKMKDLQKKQKQSENRKQLADLRIIQKNLVFVHGLPAGIKTDHSKQERFLEPYKNAGKIIKSIFNERPNSTGSQTLGCAYITYDKVESALKVLKSALSTMKFDGKEVKSSLGTTKYCSNYLKNVQCPKGDCMYLHEVADDEACFTKEDIKAGKHVEYGDKLYQQMVSNCSSKHVSNTTQQIEQSPPDQRNSSSRSSPEQVRQKEPPLNKFDSPPQEPTHYPLYNRHSQFVPEGEVHFPALPSEAKTTPPSHCTSLERIPRNIVNGAHNGDLFDHSWILNGSSKPFDASPHEHSSKDRMSDPVDSFFSVEQPSTFSKLSLYTNSNLLEPQPVIEEHDDDLGFDPCQLSLEGLEDLLSTEAKDRSRILTDISRNQAPETFADSRLPSYTQNAIFQKNLAQQRASGNPPPGFSGSSFNSTSSSSPSGFERNSISNRLSPIDLLNSPLSSRPNIQSSPVFPSSSTAPTLNSLSNGFTPSHLRNLQIRQMLDTKNRALASDPRILRGIKSFGGLPQAKPSSIAEQTILIRPPSPINHRLQYLRSTEINNRPISKFNNFSPFSESAHSLFPNLLNMQESKGIPTFP